MAQQKPQNPIFRVNDKTLDTCLPKLLCPHCGTVIAIRMKHRHSTVRCPSCDESTDLASQGEKWQAAQ